MVSLFRQKLEEGLQQQAIVVSDQNLDQLERYFHELRKWNKKVNLVAKSASELQIVENHFLDSLTLLPLMHKESSHLVDIGTGGGFPGLVCKVALPTLQMSLVEPRLKRVSFLKNVVRLLGLSKVDIYSERVEELADLAEDTSISHITGRAVTEVGAFLQMVEPFAATGAEVVMMKGPKWKQEMDAAADLLDRSSFRLARILESQLPFSGARRYILIFKGN